jgi:hypothetical protein
MPWPFRNKKNGCWLVKFGLVLYQLNSLKGRAAKSRIPVNTTATLLVGCYNVFTFHEDYRLAVS